MPRYDRGDPIGSETLNLPKPEKPRYDKKNKVPPTEPMASCRCTCNA